MSHDPDDMVPGDVVRVRIGSQAQVESWRGALRAAGVRSQVVGDHFVGGLGTALQRPPELWVRREDAAAATAAIGDAEGASG
jgi:hypothetical protein